MVKLTTFFLVAGSSDSELLFVWGRATLEAKAIILLLTVFSIFAWTIMASKSTQMRRAKRLNRVFAYEFRSQKAVTEIYERRVQVDGCPLYNIYQAGCTELSGRLKAAAARSGNHSITLKGMEHVKRALERAVAEESLKLESGLILLAIAVSGAPFLGLLGTVWGVMSTFGQVAMKEHADLVTMAPGVAAALITTVAGLLVAIPSMFGYNYLVHNLRVVTVDLDNFAQELMSKMEIEYLTDNDSE